MDTILFIFYVLAYLILLFWGVRMANLYGWMSSANVLLLVIAALIYENGILASGSTIGEGAVLKNLNFARYWLHALFTPMLVLFAWNVIKRAKVHWATNRKVGFLALLIVIVLISLEVFTQLIGLELEAKKEYGVLCYRGKEMGAPVMVIVVTLTLLISSVMIWWKQKWPWLLIGILAMGGGSALFKHVASGAIMNGTELVLMISLIATKRFQDTST
ncbi:hypothetical protein [Mesobacillus maritimus]|uniref:Phospholipid phosphatase n=1 Tax=Mesobacillus maritimus TaxID=1643336 RepID=A0ABS7K7T3_9BACI|nr:hypothetical protein [Mesobacillus maritimus]MBY0098336.1 hypothetical protein [Mesobacillus maritimus]